ncbi:hypothetical protein A2U01_0115461, partial [Trifolium medium]|nr:hypothetical protein [Trifolium medium]
MVLAKIKQKKKQVQRQRPPLVQTSRGRVQ